MATRGYGALLRSPGFARLYGSLLMGRLAQSMLGITLILFVLGRYHSPQLAGITAFLSIFPGLVISPVAGALLDRRGRVQFITLDYIVATVAVMLIAALSARNVLPSALLLAIVGVSSLTNPLSSVGLRSLFPIVAPRELWERANALDSSGYTISAIIGAPLAGALVGFIGPEWALVITSGLYAASAVSILGLKDPSTKRHSGRSILTDAWDGLVYVARNASLRGLAITLSTLNLSWGILEIAIPVLVLSRLHEGPAAVGFLWGLLGVGGLAASLVAGRIKTEGRERPLMLGSIVVMALALVALPFAQSYLVVAVVVAIAGMTNGPFDIAMFTMRQRRTDPAWFGRAFAVSMSLNFVGQPIGSAFAGPLIGLSLNAALWFAVAFALLAGVFPMLTIPRREDEGRASPRSAHSPAAQPDQPLR
ncbi:MAG TPA: MFS transporter [Candidatus Dormibacteraeota bacterium]|nr:MFS transporter [Candidatus Dormibacteraeota bacterium]